VTLPDIPGDGSHVYHLFVIRTDERDALAAHLRDAGIATAIHYPVAIHRQPAYALRRTTASSLSHTDAAVSEILSLPMHPHIAMAEVDEVCDAIWLFEKHRDGIRGTLVEVA
jgi:dTDP-4-amino-4,6-dideoxygalactose transaminase